MKKRNAELMNLVNQLSEKDREALTSQIMAMLSRQKNANSTSCSSLIEEVRPGRPDCPRCKAKSSLGFIVKRGKCAGAQRYICKACGKYFVPTTNTAFANGRKGADTWRKFIRYTLEGRSLAYCSEHCNIAYQTAFTWRHKILNAFKVNQQTTKMKGRVELDEMLIPISYKGNHVKGSFDSKRTRSRGEENNLPRKSYKRGSDNKSPSSKDKACVFCMVEDGNKSFYGVVPGVGYMSEKMLDNTVGKHIIKETALVIADTYTVTKKYLRDNEYSHMTLLANISDNRKDHKPEIQGENHLQHVNAMHRHIRRFLASYCGVSTKYLENYISLYVWLRTNKALKQKKSIDNLSVVRIAEADCYISRKSLDSLPAVPQCA